MIYFLISKFISLIESGQFNKALSVVLLNPANSKDRAHPKNVVI